MRLSYSLLCRFYWVNTKKSTPCLPSIFTSCDSQRSLSPNGKHCNTDDADATLYVGEMMQACQIAPVNQYIYDHMVSFILEWNLGHSCDQVG